MPAFGWSVGDCIASADLIIHILKSLRDTGGASSEFQKLQTDLEFLKLVLERIKIVDVITPQTPAAQAASAAKFVNASQATLTALLDKISNFKNSLGESASKGKVKSGLRKVQWALMYADDVAKFRQILASQTASLTLFLETQNIDITKTLASDVKASQSTSASTAASQATVLQGVEGELSRLSITVNDGLRSWKEDQSLQNLKMARELAERDNRTMTQINRCINDGHRTWNRLIEKSETHQKKIESLEDVAIQQNSLLDTRLTSLHTSMAENTKELADLCSGIQSATQSLKAAARRFHFSTSNYGSSSRLLSDRTLEPSPFRSTDQDRFADVSNGTHHTDRKRAAYNPITPCRRIKKEQWPRSINNLKGFISRLVETVIIGLWLALWKLVSRALTGIQAVRGAILYKCPPLLIQNGVELLDALGRVRILQYDVCRDWQTFAFILQRQFLNQTGYEKVCSGEYFLLDLFQRIDYRRIRTGQMQYFLAPG